MLRYRHDDSNDFFHLQEKADTIMDEEEELFKAHMAYLKEDAQLLTEEGELINSLQQTEECDIDGYINRMESVVKKKLDLYQNLYGRIQKFKKHLKEEDEIHTKVSQTKQIYY